MAALVATALGGRGTDVGSVPVLTPEDFEATLATRTVSLVQFFDSSCLNCGDLDTKFLDSTNVLAATMKRADGQPGSDVGVFRVDLAGSEAAKAIGIEVGALRGRETLRVYRGKEYTRAYTGGRRPIDVVNFLAAVRDGGRIAEPRVMRPLPSRAASTSYVHAVAMAEAQATVLANANAFAAAESAAYAAAAAAAMRASFMDGKSVVTPLLNYTAAAQQLIAAEDPLFLPKDPRHLGLYEYAAWHSHQVGAVE